ncbi:MAG: YceI family protein [Streptosporangiaceae bacterium]
MSTPAQQATSALQAQVASGALAGSWTLDPARSTVTLRSKSVWGLVPVKGAFREVAGRGTVGPAGEVSGRIEIGAASVDTGNAKRDKHLRSDDFFLSDKYPVITFDLDRLTVTGDGLTVVGALTVRERSQRLTFPATAAVAGDGEVALDATIEVNRADFGLTWNQLGMSSSQNTISIHAVFTRG